LANRTRCCSCQMLCYTLFTKVLFIPYALDWLSKQLQTNITSKLVEKCGIRVILSRRWRTRHCETATCLHKQQRQPEYGNMIPCFLRKNKYSLINHAWQIKQQILQIKSTLRNASCDKHVGRCDRLVFIFIAFIECEFGCHMHTVPCARTTKQ
jgi:hypothetical protein